MMEMTCLKKIITVLTPKSIFLVVAPYLQSHLGPMGGQIFKYYFWLQIQNLHEKLTIESVFLFWKIFFWKLSNWNIKVCKKGKFNSFTKKNKMKADWFWQNVCPLSWNRKISQRQTDVRTFFKEVAWLTNHLPRSATWGLALPTNSASHATPGTEQRLGPQAGKRHDRLQDRTCDFPKERPAHYH